MSYDSHTFYVGNHSYRGHYKGRKKVYIITRVRQDQPYVVREPERKNGCWCVVCKIEEGTKPRNCKAYARKNKLTCNMHEDTEWVAQHVVQGIRETWEDPIIQAVLDILQDPINEYGLETNEISAMVKDKVPEFKDMFMTEQDKAIKKALRLLNAREVWVL